jgi:hypothetical protein
LFGLSFYPRLFSSDFFFNTFIHRQSSEISIFVLICPQNPFTG